MNARAAALACSALGANERGTVSVSLDADGAASPPEPRTRSLAPVVDHSRVRVTVTQGPDAGVSRELVSNLLRVGSSSDNDLALTDGSVSQHHCAIEPAASGVRVRDQRSANGVFIGAVRVFDALVNGPVQLHIGRSVLAIEPLDVPAARGAAADAGLVDAGLVDAGLDDAELDDAELVEPLVPLRAARREATRAFERAYLANVLKRTRGNITRAAELAEVSRQMMQKLMRKHGAA